MFSDQCSLIYLPRLIGKYKCFCEAIAKDRIRYSEYNKLERKNLDYLIEKRIVFVDENGYIRIKNYDKVLIYYWRCSIKKRKELDDMIETGLLFSESTLFSRNEQDYFNYYLNKSKFVDGLDIRNSNLHGTQKGDNKSEIHYKEYLQIMILLILVLIKINDDICLYEEIESKKTN